MNVSEYVLITDCGETIISYQKQYWFYIIVSRFIGGLIIIINWCWQAHQIERLEKKLEYIEMYQEKQVEKQVVKQV
jgi:hypothetical protein